MEIVALVFAAGAFVASCLAIMGLVLVNKTQQGFRQSLNVFFESQEKIAGEIAGIKQSDQGAMIAALMSLAPLAKQLLDSRPLTAPLDDSRSRKADDIRRKAARGLKALGIDPSAYVGEDDDDAGDPDPRAVIADYLRCSTCTGFEFGSRGNYLVPGRGAGSLALGRMLLSGPSLLSALYPDVTDEEAQSFFRKPGYNKAFFNLNSELFNNPTGLFFIQHRVVEND